MEIRTVPPTESEIEMEKCQTKYKRIFPVLKEYDGVKIDEESKNTFFEAMSQIAEEFLIKEVEIINDEIVNEDLLKREIEHWLKNLGCTENFKKDFHNEIIFKMLAEFLFKSGLWRLRNVKEEKDENEI